MTVVISIRNQILRNPGPLSEEEFALVRLHPTYGLRLLAPLRQAYRPAWTEHRARGYLQEQAGQHFDPQVVDVFMSLAA